MNKTSIILLLAVSALLVLLPPSEAKLLKDYIKINARVPGDELILHSTASQKLDFFATVKIQVRYPEKLPHSDYILGHLLFSGKDNDKADITSKFDHGGPGDDFMRMKIILESVTHGQYDLFVYGKKK